MALKSCRECKHPVSANAKVCPHCGAEKPGWGSFAYAFPALFALLLMGMCAYPVLSKEDPFQWSMKSGESMAEWDRRLDEAVEERIRCLDPSFLVRVIMAGGSYELMALDQSRIMMCGWKTNLFETFVVDRGGCIVKKKHRWQMNNVDAKRVRECFEGWGR